MHTILPSTLGYQSIRIGPNKVLPTFIDQQDPHSKGHGHEPVLNWNRSGTENWLKSGNVEPEERHDERKENGGEKPDVLRAFVEERRLLEDRESTGTGGEEVKPLPVRCMLVLEAKVSDRRHDLHDN